MNKLSNLSQRFVPQSVSLLMIFSGLVIIATSLVLPTIVRAEMQQKSPAISNDKTVAGAIRQNPVDEAEMVYIPAGTFKMGDDGNEFNSNPRHNVMLTGYWIYKNLVTVGQYKAFCKATNRKMPPEVIAGSENASVIDSNGRHEVTYTYINFNPNWQKEDHPIVNVTWDDARAYAQWAKASLPTEAQWEKAARGTDGRLFPWGNKFEADKLWCSKVTKYDAGGTHKVGDLGVSPYGCTDMSGNVMQWCKDFYGDDYLKTDHGSDPPGPENGDDHVLRGSSWAYTPSDENYYSVSEREHFAGPPDGLMEGVVGFRCVQSATDSGEPLPIISNPGSLAGAALLRAANEGDLIHVKSLLAEGADVNMKNKQGNTALMEAADCGIAALLSALINTHSDVNIKNNDGDTALMFAASRDAACLKLLLAAGANVNAKDNYGCTPLMFAATASCAQALIAAGADVNAKDNNGKTALMKADPGSDVAAVFNGQALNSTQQANLNGSTLKQGFAWVDDKNNLHITKVKGESNKHDMMYEQLIFDQQSKIARPTSTTEGQMIYDYFDTPVAMTTTLGENKMIGTMFFSDGSMRNAKYAGVELNVSDLNGKKYDLPIFWVVKTNSALLANVRIPIADHGTLSISENYMVYADGRNNLQTGGPFARIIFNSIPDQAVMLIINRNDKEVARLSRTEASLKGIMLGSIAKTNDIVEWSVYDKQEKLLANGVIGFPVAGLSQDVVEYVIDVSSAIKSNP